MKWRQLFLLKELQASEAQKPHGLCRQEMRAREVARWQSPQGFLVFPQACALPTARTRRPHLVHEAFSGRGSGDTGLRLSVHLDPSDEGGKRCAFMCGRERTRRRERKTQGWLHIFHTEGQGQEDEQTDSKRVENQRALQLPVSSTFF